MLVNEILEQLGSQISTKEYESYIKQLKFNEKASNDDNIVFNAPNELVAKFINTRYAQKIAYLFEVKSGKKPNVSILVSNKSKNSKINQVDIKQMKTQSTMLIPNFTFENFIVGGSNQFAFEGCKAVAKNPGTMYNPVFIYGSTGLGKTHLLQSVGNYCLNNGKVVIYVTAELFKNDFINSIKLHAMDKFREKYRKCDVLLIDDVQFLSLSDRTQEEFFHTFNELHANKSQIVMTSDKPPKTLKGFEERLISRFGWGLIVDITPPELDTKIQIIKKKCEFNNITLSDEIVSYIAVNLGDSIREIEGLITVITSWAQIMKTEITLDFAKNALKDYIKEKHENITADKILDVVARELNVKLSDIKSKSRVPNIVEARRIAIYLIKNLTQNSMPSIAKQFEGMKDHSAISKNIKKINELIQTNEIFRLRVDEIKNKILTK
ncbi:chromosomal replication initiator protein DnaA [Campylobacter gastrosuis]|uniref:Chromosomal replication initiator protein DnaA n=1 Tax=Campylobacter gastrosuis TaxID=2974576 RepID=A0ABT7HRQ3_9BACT|nr:chromosomal replication initiator protein DnaA [Campylobacter gastrosuis]MDL0089313.1 chromosomal replication initiator protein DnaA [Campylobacter gastrosuis]